MLSYQGDANFKRRFVRQMDAHRKADSIVQGVYGRENGTFRGCAVGCGIHSLDRIDKVKRADVSSYGDHVYLAERLGIPLALTRLEDRIFEGLPKAKALEWPGQFSRAIPVGADLSLVWPRFAVWLLTDPKHGVHRLARTVAAKLAIAGVAKLYEREIAGDKPSLGEWRVARSAAAAADAAAAAGDAYGDAYADAYAAAAAAAAAYADAYAAAYAAAAAAAAARRKWYIAASEKLLDLMRNP